MGQYHAVYNLDKNAGYSPRSVGSLVKAAEQGESLTPCAALLLLLSDPDGWGGERIALVGDYANDDDLRDAPHPASQIWRRISDSDEVKNVGWLARKVIEQSGLATITRAERYWGGYGYTCEVPGPDPQKFAGPPIVVTNLDTRQYVTPRGLGDPTSLLAAAYTGYSGGLGTALTALLASSCKGGARGGGDYDGDKWPLVGAWAGDRILVQSPGDLDDDWQDITSDVREVMADQMHVRYEVHADGTATRHTHGYNDDDLKALRNV